MLYWLLIDAAVRSLTYLQIAMLAYIALGICWLLRGRKTLLLAIAFGLFLGWHYLYVKPMQDYVAQHMAEEARWWRLHAEAQRQHDEEERARLRRIYQQIKDNRPLETGWR